MSNNYDLVVIGTGTAATTVARKARAAGRSVAVTDFRPYGGTCALRGCDPKKMLIGGASAVDHATRMRGKGVAGDVAIDWTDLMAFKRGFTDPVPEKKESGFAEAGIDSYHGRARFVGRNAVEVDGRRLEAQHIVVAAGAEPVRLGIEGEEHLIDNEAFLEMESLPRRILLVGGGYIAAEFSHIAARAGAEVTILQHGERMLKGFDPDLVGWLMEKFAELGVDVRTGTEVTRVERRGGAFVVTAMANDEEMTFEADLVIHAAGRSPDLDSLDLAAGGVELRDGRIALNDQLQSVSNPAVHAAGDAAQMGPPLTPVSNHDGKVVAANLLEGQTRRPNYDGVPSVVFTIPPLARVGLGEEEARAEGLTFRVTCDRTPGWFTARQAAETVMGHKVLIEDGSGRILGAHLLGPHADEVINVFALAVRHGLTVDQLADTMFAYPSGASDISSML
ncbi:MAG: pyridine nucleotide-disulfide oxidoreductase [Acidimicrobiaceae bacterium]|uniref:dihydrolipoyl dehydrogenase family protein n=1 Tax=Indioceanicola profundi TaxID=2220096 RepID=UPI000C90219F|nr:NAD(P)/FAD-dependent oxidoreductase [Indioceanicola profundi]MAT03513.1 pyridine nucleotide-disulfide oxidoreductase [Acidimicrobiaceae bacterium]